MYNYHIEKIQCTAKFYKQKSISRGENKCTSLIKRKINVQQVLRTEIRTQEVPRAKTSTGEEFHEQNHVSPREKSTCNKFH